MTKAKNKEFMILYEEHHKALSNYCYSLEMNKEDAKELMSESISRAFESFHKLKEKAKFKSFLFGIARNVLREKIRKKSRKIENDSPIQKADLSFTENYTIKNILQLIPDKHAETFLLYEIADLSLKEVSEVQGTNINTVKTRLTRAREELKALLQQEYSQHLTN